MGHAILENTRPLSDEEVRLLHQKYLSGDKASGFELIRSQSPWILSRVRSKKIPSSVDVDDVLSSFMLTLLESLNKFDPDIGTLSTFFARVIDRRVYRIIRQLTGKTTDTPQEILDTLEARNPSDRSDSYDAEQIQTVRDVMLTASLSKEARIVLEEHLEGWPLQTIADRLNEKSKARGIRIKKHSPSSVHGIIQKSLAIIREALANRGELKIPGGHQQFLNGMQP